MLVDCKSNFVLVRADEGVELFAGAEEGKGGHRLHFVLGRQLAQVVHVHFQKFTFALQFGANRLARSSPTYPYGANTPPSGPMRIVREVV